MGGILTLHAEIKGSIDSALDGLDEARIRAIIRPIVAKVGPEFVSYTAGLMGSAGSPSAVGGYPGIVSGVLAASLNSEVFGDGLHTSITAGAYYAKYLEGGTSKMGARPFMEPSLEVIGDRFVQQIQSAIAGL